MLIHKGSAGSAVPLWPPCVATVTPTLPDRSSAETAARTWEVTLRPKSPPVRPTTGSAIRALTATWIFTRTSGNNSSMSGPPRRRLMSELAASFPDGLAELASRLSGLALGGELTLIIVVGGPGVGKSTLAREFASQTDSIHFELDEIKRRIVPEEDAKQGIDSTEHRYAYYAEAIRQLPEYFTRSPTHIVIVDETLHLQVYRQFWQEAADELDITVHWINANADDEVVKRRLLRGTGRKGHILGDESHDMYLLFGEQYDPMQRPHEDVDTGLDTVLQVRRIVRKLGIG